MYYHILWSYFYNYRNAHFISPGNNSSNNSDWVTYVYIRMFNILLKILTVQYFDYNATWNQEYTSLNTELGVN